MPRGPSAWLPLRKQELPHQLSLVKQKPLNFWLLQQLLSARETQVELFPEKC